jgi:polyhydroxybutyrate depolymerase
MRRAKIFIVLVISISSALMTTSAVSAQSSDGSRPPMASEACGSASADPEVSPSVEIDEGIRSLRTHIPSAHDGATPLPLIIWLHGQGMSASDMDDVTNLSDFGERHGIVVTAPQGHDPDSGWMWEPGTAEFEPGVENRDVAFIGALLDQLGSELCLDLARVYATGYSIGGHGASVLACRLSDRIAAVAAAPMFADLGDSCAASRAVPMLAFHQTGDEYVLFEGELGDFLGDTLPWGTTKGEEPFFQRADWSVSTVDRAESIALRDGCQAGATSTPIAEGVVRLSWACPEGADVGLVVVEGGGHDWMIEGGPDTNELMWAFLSRFALPQ